MGSGGDEPLLLLRAGGRLCALPLRHVVEVMRPLPVIPLTDSSSFVLGVAVVRGEPTPVVGLGVLLGAGDSVAGRFLSLRVDDRPVVLAVDAVLDVRSLPPAMLGDPPPLLQGASRDVVDAVAALDAELLLVLDEGRLLAESVLADDAPVVP
jgi:purine-binding chemotaxis protein CheW